MIKGKSGCGQSRRSGSKRQARCGKATSVQKRERSCGSRRPRLGSLIVCQRPKAGGMRKGERPRSPFANDQRQERLWSKPAVRFEATSAMWQSHERTKARAKLRLEEAALGKPHSVSATKGWGHAKGERPRSPLLMIKGKSGPRRSRRSGSKRQARCGKATSVQKRERSCGSRRPRLGSLIVCQRLKAGGMRKGERGRSPFANDQRQERSCGSEVSDEFPRNAPRFARLGSD